MKVEELKEQDIELSKDNPILKKFERYLSLEYSNKTTQKDYTAKCRKFIKDIMRETGEEPTELLQEHLDTFIILLNSKKTQNSAYVGFIKALRRCYDPEERLFRLKTKTNRSRAFKPIKTEYSWLPEEKVKELIEKSSEYISVTQQLFWDTAGRKMDIINLDLNNQDWGMNLDERWIRGIGKGNKEFKITFSKATAKRVWDWLLKCQDPSRPFIQYKANGEPHVDQGKAYYDRLQKEANALGIRLHSGKPLHPHYSRHSKLHDLATKGWNTEQRMVKARHVNPKDAAIYGKPSEQEVREKEDKEVFDT